MKKNLFIALIFCVCSIHAKRLNNIYVETLFGGCFEGTAKYTFRDYYFDPISSTITDDLYTAYIAPYYFEVKGGYTFPRANVSAFLSQQIGFESGTISSWEYKSSLTSIGVIKTIPIHYSMLSFFASAGYKWESLTVDESVLIKAMFKTPSFNVGTNLSFKFLPVASFLIGYRLGINAGKEQKNEENESYLLYDQGVIQNQFVIGLKFHKSTGKRIN